jgi:hypothetical protein
MSNLGQISILGVSAARQTRRSTLRMFLVLIVFSLGLDASLFGQSVEYISVNDGKYASENTWKLPPNDIDGLDCSLSNNHRLFINHRIQIDCEKFELYGEGELNIAQSGAAEITGDLELFGDAQIIIEEGSSLHVHGNLVLSGNSDLDIQGTLHVDGNVHISGEALACGNGSAFVAGAISGRDWCYDIQLTTANLLLLKATFDQDQSVTLNWNARPNAPSGFFILSRSYNGMSYDIISKLKSDASSNRRQFTFRDNPMSGQTVYYRITEYDGKANMKASDLAAITLLDDPENLCRMEINPNPCIPSCIAKVVDCPDGIFQTNILDATGNLISELVPAVEESGNIQYHINRDNFLSPGVYIINSQSDKARVTKKVIVK